MVVIFYSLFGHINILFSELLKDYPHQFCSSVLPSPDDDRKLVLPKRKNS